ncbi:hypothetical protein [Corynebacterium heidelbergense]|uniref:hypothetical protein n=1 Tax=Corynebacterium heidelbergense TaxID=2055947 RepID=UPI001EE74F1A|nr:hypothetical protein [Corynebacterium heidelbergense]
MKDLPGKKDLPPSDRPGPPSQLDYEADPLLRLEHNERSTRQAIRYFIAVPVVTLLTALVIALISRGLGGPYCDDGVGWLCSRSAQIWFAVLPGLISIGGFFGAAWICYLKWKNHTRWRPWIGVVWFLMPFMLMWVTSTGALLLLGH